MSNLAVFSNESFGNVRTILIDGEPWFVAKDVANALGYTSTNMTTIFQAIPEEWIHSNPIATNRGVRETLIVSEQGLYFFLGRSDKPKALPFQKWLAGEVLPSIRKTGGYGNAPKALPKDYVSALEALLATEKERLALSEQNAVMAPKADTYDNVVADRQCTLTAFARKLDGVNTVTIKKSLLLNEIMYRTKHGYYRVYSKYRDTYFSEKYDEGGITQIIVLDKGKQLLTKLYKERKLIMKGQK